MPCTNLENVSYFIPRCKRSWCRDFVGYMYSFLKAYGHAIVISLQNFMVQFVLCSENKGPGSYCMPKFILSFSNSQILDSYVWFKVTFSLPYTYTYKCIYDWDFSVLGTIHLTLRGLWFCWGLIGGGISVSKFDGKKISVSDMDRKNNLKVKYVEKLSRTTSDPHLSFEIMLKNI